MGSAGVGSMESGTPDGVEMEWRPGGRWMAKQVPRRSSAAGAPSTVMGSHLLAGVSRWA